jgi:anti-sigma factor RsiW
MTLNHHNASRLFSAYLDGELSAPESQAVQEHLMDCVSCREAYEGIRSTKLLLRELPVAEPPGEFWAAVRTPQHTASQAGAGWASPPGGRWRGRRLSFLRRPAWALAAALVILAIAVAPLIKGTADRLHATEIGVDLYVREHALGMGAEPLTDRAYLGLVAGDADLVLAGETPRAGGGHP